MSLTKFQRQVFHMVVNVLDCKSGISPKGYYSILNALTEYPEKYVNLLTELVGSVDRMYFLTTENAIYIRKSFDEMIREAEQEKIKEKYDEDFEEVRRFNGF